METITYGPCNSLSGQTWPGGWPGAASRCSSGSRCHWSDLAPSMSPEAPQGDALEHGCHAPESELKHEFYLLFILKHL